MKCSCPCYKCQRKEKCDEFICTLQIAKPLKLVTNKKLLQGIRRRVAQQDESIDEELTNDDLRKMELECWNDAGLGWTEALENITEKQNSGIRINEPLSDTDLIAVDTLLEDNTTVPLDVLLETSSILRARSRDTELVDQLLMHFPALYVNVGRKMLVNIWQVDFSADDFNEYVVAKKENTEGCRERN